MVTVLSVLLSFVIAAAEPQLLPEKATLTGPRAEQQFLVVAASPQHGTVADLTRQAVFDSSDPAVAWVDQTGVVHAASDGAARITARLNDGRSVSATVRVEGTSRPFVWSFRNHVLPVMTKAGCNSGPCHGAASGQNYFKLTLRGYAPEVDYQTLTRQAGARRVLTLAPAHSLMLLKPTLAVAHGGGRRFTVESTEYRVLSEWIAAGAPPPREDDPRLTGLELLPSRATLHTGDRHRFLVRATFSDGHVEDVTRWTKYSSTDMSVLRVSEEGEAKIEGPGDAAVTIWYLNRVALARITVPLTEEVDPALYRALPRRNFIDQLAWKKLEELRIRPSPPAGDAGFLRRAYLECAGILPTVAEAKHFLNDTRPDKRMRVIEELLARPEFVDYWTYKWSDLLLVSSGNLPAAAVRSYYDWIRSSVAANKPWDRFVRELLTATGSNLENGAANYYVQHDEPTAIAENASLTFLGISVNCARCHNHPLDRWTQDDYYSLASFFARLGRKGEERPGETTVFVCDSGDVRHPRLGKPVSPRPLGGDAAPTATSADRREAFAQWLVSPRNRYFVRSIVNRVWHGFMGKGLVDPIDEMRDTNPASNEELLDALADDFIEHGFDLKHLIRTIMNSAVYQTDSAPRGGNGRDDKYWSHYLVRRLPAEVLLDAICQVTGVPEKFPGYPPGTRALQLPDAQVDSYFLTLFGRPKRETNSHVERVRDSSIPQALQLINGEVLNQKLHAQGGTIDALLARGLSDAQIIDEIYWRALSRPPDKDEMASILAVLDEAREDRSGRGEREKSRRRALADFCAGVLMSDEFLFNH